jgi:3-phosphoshikimate 1-carboxyvinyltransferase
MDVDPVDCPPRLTIRNPSSSQEVSALLFALAARGGGAVTVEGAIPSEPYLRMTESVLSEFGVEVDERDGLFTVAGTLSAPAAEIAVEPDASAAAALLAAGCISGGKVRVAGLTSQSVQGDLRIIEHLRAFGCCGTVEAEGTTASGIPRRGAKIDLVGEPDLAPILAAVAAMACLHSGEPSLLEGLGTLEGKESPRLSGLAKALSLLGWQVRSGSDWLGVDAAPGGPPDGAGPVALDPAGDHRMAFAFALLGLGFTGVRIPGCGCVGKSYPNFWEDLHRAGANIQA